MFCIVRVKWKVKSPFGLISFTVGQGARGGWGRGAVNICQVVKCMEQWDSEVNDSRDLECYCHRKFRLYAALCLFVLFTDRLHS